MENNYVSIIIVAAILIAFVVFMIKMTNRDIKHIEEKRNGLMDDATALLTKAKASSNALELQNIIDELNDEKFNYNNMSLQIRVNMTLGYCLGRKEEMSKIKIV